MINDKDQKRYFFGILIVLIGVFLFIRQLGIFPSLGNNLWTLFTKFWPLLLLFLGVKLYISNNRVIGSITLLLSVSFLFNTLLDFRFFSVLMPILIIGIGLSLLFKEERKNEDDIKYDTRDISQNLFFKDQNLKVESEDFKGGHIDVLVGSLQLDLRKVRISKGGAKLNINCTLGNVDILVPKECRVKSQGSRILGDWVINLKERDTKEPVLNITGDVLFGKVSIEE